MLGTAPMDTTEETILKAIADNELVNRKSLKEQMSDEHFDSTEIDEAVDSLEKNGFVSRFTSFGDESLILTKEGKREARDAVL